jgi:hypothetical protein
MEQDATGKFIVVVQWGSVAAISEGDGLVTIYTDEKELMPGAAYSFDTSVLVHNKTAANSWKYKKEVIINYPEGDGATPCIAVDNTWKAGGHAESFCVTAGVENGRFTLSLSTRERIPQHVEYTCTGVRSATRGMV